jgi:DNA invertase Pin-like site-specific DNA recombinase
MRLIGYVRVSRVGGREGDSFISPSVQRERIEAFAASQGHEVVVWEEDLDQPGSRYERRGFQAALEAVERGEAEGIAVAALDRFARSVPDAAVALRRLEAVGATLVSVRDALDTSTAVGRFARTMMLALAELELERIRENWATARDRAIARGVHISRIPPVGYRRGEDRRLEPDPATGPVIRELFRRRAAGASWRELSEFLDERLPREQGNWTHQTISSIISRRTYLGEAYQGEVVNREAHEPLVTLAEWEAAQSGDRRPSYQRRGGALLAGIIRCAGCGYPLSRNSGGRRGYAFYRCRGRHSAGLCPAPARISVPRADGYVEQAFLAWAEQERIAAEAAPRDDELEQAAARVETAEAELTTYRDANLISVIGRDAYIEGLEQRQRTLDEARAQLAQARRIEPTTDIQELHSLWPQLEVTEKRRLLAAVIDAVFVRQATSRGRAAFADRIEILWYGQAPSELPGRRLSQLRPYPFQESAAGSG